MCLNLRAFETAESIVMQRALSLGEWAKRQTKSPYLKNIREHVRHDLICIEEF